MEQSGRNRWQPVANGTRPESAQTSETVALGCDQLPAAFHGKEGVDGSSPSEGLKVLHTGTSCCLFRHDAGELYGGGQRGGDLQALRVFAAPIDGREGTLREHAATVGSHVSCSSS
jgi:hypothetical protein